VTHSIVTVAAAPVRAEPSHQAERVTEWLCGEVVAVLGRAEGWARGCGPDAYEGWVTESALLAAESSEVDAWRREATLWSLGTELVGDSRGAVNRLPWGGRARPAGGGRLALPNGAIAVARHPERLVPDLRTRTGTASDAAEGAVSDAAAKTATSNREDPFRYLTELRHRSPPALSWGRSR
jgi:hypothetical protein